MSSISNVREPAYPNRSSSARRLPGAQHWGAVIVTVPGRDVLSVTSKRSPSKICRLRYRQCFHVHELAFRVYWDCEG